MGRKTLSKGLRMEHLSGDGKGGHPYSHEPLRMSANRAQLGPRNRMSIVWGFSAQGGYLHWEMPGLRHTHTHTVRLQGCSTGDCSPPWHREAGPCPLRAAGSTGLKEVLQDPLSCLQRGVHKQPHHLWPNALHSPLLDSSPLPKDSCQPSMRLS